MNIAFIKNFCPVKNVAEIHEIFWLLKVFKRLDPVGQSFSEIV